MHTNLEPISLRPTLLFDSSKNMAISALHSAGGRKGGREERRGVGGKEKEGKRRKGGKGKEGKEGKGR